jgi:hypothetical protein
MTKYFSLHFFLDIRKQCGFLLRFLGFVCFHSDAKWFERKDDTGHCWVETNARETEVCGTTVWKYASVQGSVLTRRGDTGTKYRDSAVRKGARRFGRGPGGLEGGLAVRKVARGSEGGPEVRKGTWRFGRGPGGSEGGSEFRKGARLLGNGTRMHLSFSVVPLSVDCTN